MTAPPLIAGWLDVAPDLSTSSDRNFFLDTRRSHRLRSDGVGGAVVVRRDGAMHRLAILPDEVADLTSAAFAARMFEIYEKVAEPKPRRSLSHIFCIFRRLAARRKNSGQVAA